MNLIKTSFLTAISTVVKILSGFIINKIVAIYIGPTGLALIGQLRNFTSIIMTFSNGGINAGIVKYIAEYKDDINEQTKIISGAFFISILCSVFLGIIIFLFSEILSVLILNYIHYSIVFKLLAFTVIFFSLNSLFVSIVNGKRDIKKYILINISTSLISLLFTTLLVIKLQLIGAFYAIVLNQSIVFFITILFVMKSKWFKIKCFINRIEKNTLLNFAKFASMAATTALTVPVSLLIIRNHIGSHISWEAAGYWEGMWRISESYLTLIIMSLSVYYLPRLSEIKDNKELKDEIIHGFKIIIPIVSCMALGIYFLKQYVILILFTDKFLPMIELFKWQLIGDVIKVGCWLLGMVTIAKAMTKIFIIAEISCSLLFVFSSMYFISVFGLIGVTYAFTLTYSLYLIPMIFVLKRKFNE